MRALSVDRPAEAGTGLCRREPARTCAPADEDGRRRRADRRAHSARGRAPPRAIAPRGPRSAAPAPSATSATPRRPAVARTGSATIPAVRWTIREASASSRLASRPSARRSDAAPIGRSGASGGAREPRPELERRPVMPGRRRTARRPGRRRRAAASKQERHVARRSLQDDGRGAAKRTLAGVHQHEVDALLGSEPGRRRRQPPARRTPRSGSRTRRPISSSRARDSRAVAAATSSASTTAATISSRGGIACGERLRETEERVERVGVRLVQGAARARALERPARLSLARIVRRRQSVRVLPEDGRLERLQLLARLEAQLVRAARCRAWRYASSASA